MSMVVPNANFERNRLAQYRNTMTMYLDDHHRLANLNRTSYRRGAGHCQDNYQPVKQR